ncbi:MAG: hypothetical protein IID48_21270 [Proteobacteria bacterium]|nr:hypothetical protein [Pseudomonadota bacterium]
MPTLYGRNVSLQERQLAWASLKEDVLTILGPTGVILPFGDPNHGQPNATTFTTIGDEQVAFEWSEAPNGFVSPLDLTNPDSFQGINPIVRFNKDAEDDEDADDADDIDDDEDAEDADDTDDTEHEDLDDESAETAAEPAAKTAGKNAESLTLIGKLLAKSGISQDLREELEGYKADIAEGDFGEADRRYLKAISARLLKRR